MPDTKWAEIPGKKGLYRFTGDLHVTIEAIVKAQKSLVTSTSTEIKDACKDVKNGQIVLGRNKKTA